MAACAEQYGKYAVWSPSDNSCVCAANYQATAAACGYNTYTVLSADFTIPSGLPGAQRRSLEARHIQRERCPRGLAECAISGGFECIDPRNDLGKLDGCSLAYTSEACGGCLGANGTE
jgi:hypothetical protein